eukprot:INCI5139.24.p1 GENE.INCI5139.24~~INCI5139.24.p1  ORF type:complete len:488 (+),score=59.76 INCI5139.24:219-1682(+)
MRVAFLVVLLFVRAVCSTDQEEEDLRRLVAVLVEQNTQLTAAADGIRADLSQLQQQHGALVASTTAQRHEHALWQREATAKLQSLVGGRRLSAPVSAQRRGLSSGTCADPSGPRLLVDGVCSCTGGLLVEGRNVTAELDDLLDVTDCSHLVPQGNITDSTSMQGVRSLAVSPDGKYVYAPGYRSHSLAVVDVGTNHTAPTTVGSIISTSSLKGAYGVAVSVDGKYAFVTAMHIDSLAVVDVGTDPTSPTVVGKTTADGTRMDRPYAVATSPNGIYVYVASILSGLAVVDIGNPTNPVVVGSITEDSMAVDLPWDVAVSPDGKYAFVVGKSSDNLVVVDVGTDATNPTLVASMTSDNVTMDGASGVAVSPDGKYVFVTGSASHSIAVVDVGTDITNPTVVGGITGDSTNIGSKIAMSPFGTHAFVTGANLAAVDVGSDPTNIRVIDSAIKSGASYVVTSPDGKYIYVSRSNLDNLVVVRWQNCTEPQH